MSETSSSGLLDESGRKITTQEAVEPLIQYVQKNPVCTAILALALGYVLGKIL